MCWQGGGRGEGLKPPLVASQQAGASIGDAVAALRICSVSCYGYSMMEINSWCFCIKSFYSQMQQRGF